MIIETDNFFPALLQKKIIKLITHQTFSWYYSPGFDEKKLPEIKNIKKDKNIVFGHGFVHTLYRKDKQNNIDYPFDLLSMFTSYTEQKFGIKVNSPLRLQCSFTLPQNTTDNQYMVPHVDWMFPHYTVIYYITDSEGDTFIFNEKSKLNQKTITKKELFHLDETLSVKSVLKRINPKQGKAAIFDGLHYHAGSYPLKTNRYILNFNFI